MTSCTCKHLGGHRKQKNRWDGNTKLIASEAFLAGRQICHSNSLHGYVLQLVSGDTYLDFLREQWDLLQNMLGVAVVAFVLRLESYLDIFVPNIANQRTIAFLAYVILTTQSMNSKPGMEQNKGFGAYHQLSQVKKSSLNPDKYPSMVYIEQAQRVNKKNWKWLKTKHKVPLTSVP